ncbi:STAS domain-containing protein [Saccharopolyspora sp. TS4A08]|uniref:STAS domain-containing protein n=1 Tax=Saccharopolyspora ipomoeae TaxID=3042027 RepID=A0ABT6PV20_9PSEU|nr:STAS domain-containing protein [Saccharopolyspora sp. TS4A08]MDI2031843.1 STAS domain-containing protein [Saccharopolyspora sp. TS4A08]
MANADLPGPVPPQRGGSSPATGPVSGALRVRVFEPGEGVAVVQVDGELDLAARDLLTGPLAERLASAVTVLVLDLSRVTFINSDGVTALVEARRVAQQRRTELVLVSSGVVDRLLRLLDLTGRFSYAARQELPAR